MGNDRRAAETELPDNSRKYAARARLGVLRLDPRDLRAIASVLARADNARWWCTKTTFVGAHYKKWQLYHRVRVEYKAGSFDELAAVAPRGMLSHLQIEFWDGPHQLEIQIGDPDRTRTSELRASGPGEAPPPLFNELHYHLDRRHIRRVLALALPIPIMLYAVGMGLVVFFSDKNVSESTRALWSDLLNDPVSTLNEHQTPLIWAAVGCGVLYLVLRAIVLRARINGARLSRRQLALPHPVGNWRQQAGRLLLWIRSLYSPGGYSDDKMMIVAATSLFVAVLALVVTIVK